MNTIAIGSKVAILKIDDGTAWDRYLGGTGIVTELDPMEGYKYVVKDVCRVGQMSRDLYCNEVVAVPEVGQEVKALEVPMYPQLAGSIVTVTDVFFAGQANKVGSRITGPKPLIYAEFPSLSKPDDTILLAFHYWEPVNALPEGVVETDIVEVKTIPVADHDRTVESLNARIRNLEVQVEAGREANRTANRMLLEQAESRGWCSEFEEFIDDWNEACPGGYEWTGREQDFEVEIEVEVTYKYTTTVTARAATQDAADDMVRDDVDSYTDNLDHMEEIRYTDPDEVSVDVR